MFLWFVYKRAFAEIKTRDSAKKKQAICDEQVSYLHIVLISHHKSYRLVIKDSARSNYIHRISYPTMEEISTIS